MEPCRDGCLRMDRRGPATGCNRSGSACAPADGRLARNATAASWQRQCQGTATCRSTAVIRESQMPDGPAGSGSRLRWRGTGPRWPPDRAAQASAARLPCAVVRRPFRRRRPPRRQGIRPAMSGPALPDGACRAFVAAGRWSAGRHVHARHAGAARRSDASDSGRPCARHMPIRACRQVQPAAAARIRGRTPDGHRARILGAVTAGARQQRAWAVPESPRPATVPL